MMRLKLLGKSGLRVSELCLGTMTFGNDWGWGAEKDEARRIFEAFAEAGGNFIDSSNNYTDGSSESFIGEFIRDCRDQYVVATKYTLQMANQNRHDANLGGNSAKSMKRSVENSLRRLQTDYIDLLYLHMWDFTTPIEEVLRAADDLIRQGKLLYFAMSDSPSWVVAQAVATAEIRGWPRPVAVQFPYSALSRDPEREIMPMARALDLAMTPWGLLSGGTLTGKYSQASDEARREDGASPKEAAMAEAIVKVANEIGRSPAQVAINWVRQQPGSIIPILGARTEKQIRDNLGALEFTLSDAQLQALREANDFRLGFPLSFLTSDHVRELIFGQTFKRLDNHRSGLMP